MEMRERGTPSSVSSVASAAVRAMIVSTIWATLRSDPTLSLSLSLSVMFFRHVPDLFCGEGVEGLDDRDRRTAGSGEGGDSAHPVVRVGDVRRSLAPAKCQLSTEIPHEGGQLLLGKPGRRPGGDVLDPHSVGEGRGVGLVGGGPASVDGDVMPEVAEGLCESPDVDVLAAGVGASDGRERACVLGDESDLER